MAKLWKRVVAFATLIAVLDGEAIIAFVTKALRCAASHEPSETGEACGSNDHVEPDRILPPSPPPLPEYPPPGQQMLVVPRWYDEQRRWATFAAAVALGLGTPRTLLGE